MKTLVLISCIFMLHSIAESQVLPVARFAPFGAVPVARALPVAPFAPIARALPIGPLGPVAPLAPIPPVAPLAPVAPVAAAVVPVVRAVPVPVPVVRTVPVAVPVPVPVPVVRTGFVAPVGLRPIGKRDVSSVSQENVRIVISTGAKKIELAINNQQRIGCDIEPRLNNALVDDLKVRIVDLEVVERTVNKVPILSLISPKREPLSQDNTAFTFIDPTSHQPVLVSIYPDVGILVNETGFVVKSPVCYDAIFDIITNDLKGVKVGLILI